MGWPLCKRQMKSIPLFLRRGFAPFSSESIEGFHNSMPKIFDRYLKCKQRDRAAWLMQPNDPFVDTVRDAGNLLTRAGFTLPSVDVDEYTVRYDSAIELIEHLRAMGETNALFQRSNILNRDTALATAAVYQTMFGAEDGSIPATFQVIFMTGWKDHPSQQKAKQRGSATISFNEIRKQFGKES
ncbi:NADH:ubiquinone oxidoreductase complex assembly factor [Thalictrum thalictroides]|uniref:NADH:ubiquinone oxidoreductase complex assembly factor n=1 Tax=Thalictrum thalictroides TaxID=46969 RepID=A0A7J6XFZ4_THATH|nr:NADH:ubiquinone oxidoreductase complex assembly factor [Thalictrum thalictroides]